MELPITGGCICKSIRYECTAAPLGMGNCHCRDCQYASGTGYSSVFAVPASTVTITGNPKYYESISDTGITVRRGFCPECGNPLFAGNDANKEFIGIKAATLDDPSWFKPTVDCWISSAQPWDILSPDTLKFDKELEM